MRTLNLDVVATRGGTVESRHRVHAAVVECDDLVASAGEPSLVTFWRSCAKPFQVMPLITTGGFDRVGWGDDQLALACASHGGEPEHVAIAEGMLDTLGLEEGDLACGPHEPLSSRGQRVLRDAGIRPTRLHNNCSGKHAAMIGRAVAEGWSSERYERESHPVQRDVTTEIARWTRVPESALVRAVDGCGVVVYGMPLESMARAYARFAQATARREEVPSRVAHAMGTRPFLVGGSDRFDSAVIEETDGRVIAKIGAEGVHSIALLDQGVGVALKVEDGAPRAQFPAVLRVLQQLGALPDVLPPRLAEFLVRPVRDSRGEVVGDVAPVA
jgi:L-asparaginase II